ncbi:MAG: hypothetical protein P9X26_03885 [Candidatus Stygibacter frigidus]|nr:hypothetical protein [Candidatus Stygibacter frigidus]
MQVVGRIFKYLLLIFLSIFFINIISQYKIIITELNFSDYVDVLISGVLFVILYLIILYKWMDFWESFAHELTHLIFAVITFNRIESFNATKHGGAVSYKGNSNWLTRLSPYFFPLYTALFLIISLFINEQFKVYFDHLIVISYLFFVITLVQQFSYHQSDISGSGYIFSTVFLLIMNGLVLLFLVYFLGDNLHGFIKVLQNGTAFKNNYLTISRLWRNF